MERLEMYARVRATRLTDSKKKKKEKKKRSLFPRTAEAE